MKPVDQTHFYKPDQGEHGNCLQAAVASIFELELDQVPNFMDDQSTFWDTYTDFVRSRGFNIVRAPEDMARYLSSPYLAMGNSERGCGHACVYKQGALEHDPHPSRAGLVSVDYVHIFVPANPGELVAVKGRKARSTYLDQLSYFKLNNACCRVDRAFGDQGHGSYLVGSVLERADWRDVDVRYLMDDAHFDRLFPKGVNDPFWSFIVAAVSEQLGRETGLPVDFQIQRLTDANLKHRDRPRNGIGHVLGRYPGGG